MSTQPTDAVTDLIEHLTGCGVDIATDELSYSLNRCGLTLTSAMQSARTPPPCAGDDVERMMFSELLKRGIDQDTADQVSQAVIAALGTTPSIVGQEKDETTPERCMVQRYGATQRECGCRLCVNTEDNAQGTPQ